MKTIASLTFIAVLASCGSPELNEQPGSSPDDAVETTSDAVIGSCTKLKWITGAYLYRPGEYASGGIELHAAGPYVCNTASARSTYQAKAIVFDTYRPVTSWLESSYNSAAYKSASLTVTTSGWTPTYVYAKSNQMNTAPKGSKVRACASFKNNAGALVSGCSPWVTAQ